MWERGADEDEVVQEDSSVQSDSFHGIIENNCLPALPTLSFNEQTKSLVGTSGPGRIEIDIASFEMLLKCSLLTKTISSFWSSIR